MIINTWPQLGIALQLERQSSFLHLRKRAEAGLLRPRSCGHSFPVEHCHPVVSSFAWNARTGLVKRQVSLESTWGKHCDQICLSDSFTVIQELATGNPEAFWQWPSVQSGLLCKPNGRWPSQHRGITQLSPLS